MSKHPQSRTRSYPWAFVAVLALLISGAACQDRPLFGVLATSDAGRDTGPEDAFVPDIGTLPDGMPAKDATCAVSTAEVGLLPLDMLVALDTSFSMDFLGKWRAVRSAIKAFVADASFAGVGVGLQYFPLRKECSVPEYAKPAIPIGLLPGVGPDIAKSLDGQRMSGGTPMVPMLQGVLDYAAVWAKANPERKVVVIIATDGIPDDRCIAPAPGQLPNTLSNVVAVADTGFQADPSIVTFVIGVGSELTALSQIAKAGGSGDALLVDTASNIEKAFLEALNSVRLRAIQCEYEIPEPADGKLDYDLVNVIFSRPGASETFIRVDAATNCSKGPDKGWYYDDPASPEKILLCAATCDRVQQAVDAKVDIQFGCKSRLQ